MFNNIFEYTDYIINLTKPKKLIYVAIDGVAPRAKMNHQRGRRFRAGLDSQQAELRKEELKKEFQAKGIELPKDNKVHFDSNIITPGTEFMQKLSDNLKDYLARRLETDIYWQGLTIIFSDSSVPGEGEHKILEFIRTQRGK